LKSKQVVIVGGGYSGSCLAVQLVRQSRQPIAVTIVESRPQVGPGLAYSTTDPDHRLNAPSFSHTIHPADAWHFTRWCRDQHVLDSDPGAIQPDGTTFVQRHQFGRYLSAMVRHHASWPATGSSITHCHDKAVHAERREGTWHIQLAGGQSLDGNLLLLATGNPELRLSTTLAAFKQHLPGLIENPLAHGAMDTVEPTDRVLILGTGLTALDVLSTLIRRRHSRPIDVFSRHGLRPAPQGPIPDALAQALRSTPLEEMPASLLLDRVLAPAPEFLRTAALPTSNSRLSHWLVALRHRLANGQTQGESWHTGFDELRDAVWQLWPTLPLEEKRRFVRHLKPWYDVHRYRSPPPNEQLIRSAERSGRVRFLRGTVLAGGRLVSHARPDAAVTMDYDRVINCAGLDPTSGLRSNPVLMSLHTQGYLRPHPCGLGIETDLVCRAIDQRGQLLDHLRLVGPPTLGTFGDPIGAIYIAVQVHRLVPQILASL
jgi:uncharacterized NAD(P)/FAD-binding protein YdhS